MQCFKCESENVVTFNEIQKHYCPKCGFSWKVGEDASNRAKAKVPRHDKKVRGYIIPDEAVRVNSSIDWARMAANTDTLRETLIR